MKKLIVLLSILFCASTFAQYNPLKPPPFLRIITDSAQVNKIIKYGNYARTILPGDNESWMNGDTLFFCQQVGSVFHIWRFRLGTTPTSGQVLKWNGSVWTPGADENTGGTPDTALYALKSDTANYAKSFTVPDGVLVKMINGLQDTIYMIGYGGTSITTIGDTIKVTSIDTAGGGSGGITSIGNSDGKLSIINPLGPSVTINMGTLTTSDISSGIFSVSRGGTGNSSLTSNSIIIGNGTSPVTFLTPGVGSDYNLIMSNGVSWTIAKADSNNFKPLSISPSNIRNNSIDSSKIPQKGISTGDVADNFKAPFATLADSAKKAATGGAAGGDLEGSSYPNPLIAPNKITTTKVLDKSLTLDDLRDMDTRLLNSDVNRSIIGYTDIDWQVVKSPIISFTDTIAANKTYTFSNKPSIYGHIDVYVTSAVGLPTVTFPSDIFWRDSNKVGLQDEAPWTTVYRFDCIFGKVYGMSDNYYPYQQPPGPVGGDTSGFYVSYSTGKDSNGGNWGHYSNPWKTLAFAFNGRTYNNDTIHLKRGDKWEETLTIPSSNIMITSYGSGAKPIISVKDTITGSGTASSWTNRNAPTDTVWFFSCPANPLRIWLDGKEYGQAATLAGVNSRWRWYWTSGGLLYIWTGSTTLQPPDIYSGIESPGGRSPGTLPVYSYAINSVSRSNIRIRNLQLEGGTSLKLSGGRKFFVDSCTIKDFVTGIRGVGCDSFIILANLLDYNDTIHHTYEAPKTADVGYAIFDGVQIVDGDSGRFAYNRIKSCDHSAFNMAATANPYQTRYWLIDHNEFTGGTDYGRAFDIHSYRDTSAVLNIIRNNYIHNMACQSQIAGKKTIFVGNIIDTVYEKNPGWNWVGGNNAEAKGVLIAYIDGGAYCDSVVVANNYIGNTDDAGISMQNGPTVTHCFVLNNILQNCSKNPFPVLVSSKFAGLVITPNIGAGTFRNNIIFSDSTLNTVVYRESPDNCTPISVATFNSEVVGDIIANNRSDNPSISPNRLSIINNYKPLTGSQAINNGYTCPSWMSITADIIGVSIPLGASADIGPFEQTTEAVDNIRPAPIVLSLDSMSTDRTKAYLRWFAVGDDSITGIASSYSIRYQLTDSVDSADWFTATAFSEVKVPDTSGTIQLYMGSGLNGASDYWFAVKASDGTNWSRISNSVSGGVTPPAVTAWSIKLSGSTPDYLTSASPPSNLSFDSTELINSITDRNFELGTGNWAVTGVGSSIAQGDTAFGGSSKSLRMSFDASSSTDTVKLMAVNFGEILTDHWYVFEFRIRHTSGSNYPRMGVGDSVKQLGGMTVNTWYHKQMIFRGKSTTIGAKIWVKANGSGVETIYLDSVRLYQRRPFTINAWVRHSTTTISTPQVIASTIDSSKTPATSGFRLHAGSTSNIFTWTLADGTDDYYQTWNGVTANANDSTWRLLTLVYNMNHGIATNTKFYQDTVSVTGAGFNLCDYGKIENLGQLFVGRNSLTSSGFWKGEIGQYQIVVGYGMTQDDVKNIWTLGILGTPPAGQSRGNWKWLNNAYDTDALNNLTKNGGTYLSGVGYPVR